MNIAVGGIFHETSTFSSIQTDEDYFRCYEWEYGEDIFKNHTNVRDYIGGMLAEASAKGVTILPTFAARANSSGLISSETCTKMVDHLLSALRKLEQIDGICLSLHGAGVADGVDDLEGYVLEKIRDEFGWDIPIVATLDLHANITEDMVKAANALFGVNYYPHTDCYERGREALSNLVRIIIGEIKPVMHLEKLPLIIPTSSTYFSPAKDINEFCKKWEQHKHVIDCTFFHGFSHTDIPEIGVSVLTITNNDLPLSKKASKDIAKIVWESKEKFFVENLGPKEGLEKALANEGQPVIINETSDNPGAGAPGDGTWLLKQMIEMKISNACFGFIYDPDVVQLAHEIGVGNYITVQLGGKTDTLHGEPLEINAYIKLLTDGRFIQSSDMSKGKQVNLGLAARLQVGSVDIIVASVRLQTFDEQIFLLHGIDVTKYKIVALKSSNHFRSAFEKLTDHFITVDSPGLSSVNISRFDYKRIHHPLYPLDVTAHFQY